MKKLLKVTLNIIIFLVGLFVSFRAGIKWYETGFELEIIYKWADGNAIFITLLIGLSLTMYGILQFYDYLLFKNHGDSVDSESGEK